MGFVNDMDRLGRMEANRRLIEHLDRAERADRARRAEAGQLTPAEVRAEARAARWQARKADADARRAATPRTAELDDAAITNRIRLMWAAVLAAGLLVSLVLFPVGPVLALGGVAWMWAKARSIRTEAAVIRAARDETTTAAERAEAQRYLTADDRAWLRRHDG